MRLLTLLRSIHLSHLPLSLLQLTPARRGESRQVMHAWGGGAQLQCWQPNKLSKLTQMLACLHQPSRPVPPSCLTCPQHEPQQGCACGFCPAAHPAPAARGGRLAVSRMQNPWGGERRCSNKAGASVGLSRLSTPAAHISLQAANHQCVLQPPMQLIKVAGAPGAGEHSRKAVEQ